MFVYYGYCLLKIHDLISNCYNIELNSSASTAQVRYYILSSRDAAAKAYGTTRTLYNNTSRRYRPITLPFRSGIKYINCTSLNDLDYDSGTQNIRLHYYDILYTRVR